LTSIFNFTHTMSDNLDYPLPLSTPNSTSVSLISEIKRISLYVCYYRSDNMT
jgi:hypothetical protein